MTEHGDDARLPFGHRQQRVRDEPAAEGDGLPDAQPQLQSPLAGRAARTSSPPEAGMSHSTASPCVITFNCFRRAAGPRRR
jgi:hypothetical protein